MKKHKALFTYFHNEPLWFKVFWNYYSRYFDPEDIYCIHNIKQPRVPFDDWIEDFAYDNKFNLLSVDEEQKCNFQEIVNKAQNLQRQLLDKYECVLFAELDEFVCHPNGLGQFIDNWQGKQTELCSGYEVVHMHKEYPDYGVHFPLEPDLDWNKHILSQRNYWYPSSNYNKPALTRIPLTYCWGFHYCYQARHQTPHPELLMLHLHKVDYKTAIERRLVRMKSEGELDIEVKDGEPGWQSKILGERLDGWWFAAVDDFDIKPAPHCLIPDYVKEFPI